MISTLAPSELLVPDLIGTLYRYTDFRSQFVDPRHVDVWLPPGYAGHGAQRYPVLYMHDGQNLFDPRTSFASVDWGIDEALAHLMGAHHITPPIVVGLWNTPKRFREYMPARPVIQATGQPVLWRPYGKGKTKLLSDAYLKFITQEIKPLIDATYRTLPDAAHTSTMGS
ncbi:MAG: alpha/beta hydrolase-fold protein, partial [Chloroflexota bacterium]|nr:alpha/beta hydrolase-fold protein [Chloroflexota bacterium]